MNMLAKRNPLSLLRTFGHDVDEISRLFDDVSHFYGLPTVRGVESPNFSPSISFIDKEDKYELTVEVPGIDQKNVTVELSDGSIIIKGEKKKEEKKETDEEYLCERYFGSFRRELKLPNNSDSEKIDANYKNGVLTIDIPKKEEEKPKTKKIDVKINN